MRPDGWTRDSIVAALRNAAEDRGTAKMAKRDFLRLSGLTERQVLKWFDSWNELVVGAGLTPTDKSRIPPDVLFADMRDVFLVEGRIPTQTRFTKISRYSSKCYRRFGSWHEQLQAFREWVEASGEPFALIDQIPATRSSAQSEASESADSHTERGESRGREAPLTNGRRYGPVLNFRGLQHAPINEQGVVFLFGMIAHELGYMVESVATGFPDCVAKRRVGDNWELVRIEFEYESKNFRDHGHKYDGCDLIVCWKHNWDGAPMPVVELKTAIQRLNP